MAKRKSKKATDGRRGKLTSAPLEVLPHVTFLRTEPFENIDIRRAISGVAGDFGFPLQIRQLKLIEFSADAVKNKLVVGNHRHFGESGQWEMIVVLGRSEKPTFRFHHRDYHSGIKTRLLRGGDIVVIPPGCSLALVALKPGAKAIEISNQEYRNMNYIHDELA